MILILLALLAGEAELAEAGGRQRAVQILHQHLRVLRTRQALTMTRPTASGLVPIIRRQWPPTGKPAQVEVAEEDSINVLVDPTVEGTQSALALKTLFKVDFTLCPAWSAGQSAELREQ